MAWPRLPVGLLAWALSGLLPATWKYSEVASALQIRRLINVTAQQHEWCARLSDPLAMCVEGLACCVWTGFAATDSAAQRPVSLFKSDNVRRPARRVGPQGLGGWARKSSRRPRSPSTLARSQGAQCWRSPAHLKLRHCGKMWLRSRTVPTLNATCQETSAGRRRLPRQAIARTTWTAPTEHQ